MSKILRLDLPVPPSANVYYRRGGKIIYLSPEGKAYKQDVLAAYLKTHGGKMAFPSGDVRVHIQWYRARKDGDLDNRIKPLLDALKKVAFADDKQVVEIHAYRLEDVRKKGYVVVAVEG